MKHLKMRAKSLQNLKDNDSNVVGSGRAVQTYSRGKGGTRFGSGNFGGPTNLRARRYTYASKTMSGSAANVPGFGRPVDMNAGKKKMPKYLKVKKHIHGR